MKKIIFNTALIFVLTISLVNCSKDDQSFHDILPKDNVIRVNADVSSMMVKSETDETSLTMETSDLSEFGLFIEKADNIYYSYNNILVSKSSDNGSTEWSTSEQMFWKSAIDPVLVYAYYPYNSQNNYLSSDMDLSICTNQSVADSVKASDFLYSSSVVTPSKGQKTTNPIYLTNKNYVCHIFTSSSVSVW